jgi:DNA-binding MarR family transcriptional regulator
MAVAPNHLNDQAAPDSFEALRRRFFVGRAVDLDAQAVVFSLFRAHGRVFSAIERAALRPLGLTHAGFTTLLALWMLGPLETRQLAAFLATSKPSVVSAVNTLERRKLVRRTRSAQDGRLVTVSLTAAGVRLAERAQAATHVCERRLAEAFTKSDQRTLTGLLDQLAAAAHDLKNTKGSRA